MKITKVTETNIQDTPHKVDTRLLYDKETAQAVHITLQPGESLKRHITPKRLEEKQMTKEDLKNATGMSSATIAKLGKNETINMKSLEKICEVLECDVEDVIKFIPEDKR